MAYEVTAQKRCAALGTPEVDPFVSYDAAMSKAFQPFYWFMGLCALALAGFGAVIWAKTR